MRKQYKIKPIRMSEDTWNTFRQMKIESGLTWNLFILKLIKSFKQL